MCRLYGQRAEGAASAEDPLLSHHNALRIQSHRHCHGWGVAWYERGAPRVRRGILPAHADDEFCEAAAGARSEVVLAHVRDASVGAIRAENTHPFVHGRWAFAHNGTVARFKTSARVRARLEGEIDSDLRSALAGDTDSERCFHLFLTRLRARVRPGEDATMAAVRAALAETTQVVQRCADDASHLSSLNFLVSDGRLLAACRRGRDLVHHLREGSARLFVVASEVVAGADWEPVPEGGFVGVDETFRVTRARLRGRSRRAA
jgi:predicted glutamine amidotransferase